MSERDPDIPRHRKKARKKGWAIQRKWRSEPSGWKNIFYFKGWKVWKRYRTKAAVDAGFTSLLKDVRFCDDYEIRKAFMV